MKGSKEQFEEIRADMMRNEASFWISLDWWLMHTKPHYEDNQQFKDTHKDLRKVTDEKIKGLNQAYDQKNKKC